MLLSLEIFKKKMCTFMVSTLKGNNCQVIFQVISSQCQLQQSLNNLNTYCGRNYLKMYVNKTKCIKFSKAGRLAVDEKYISKREVEFTKTCYLGVIFSSTLYPSPSKASNEQSLSVSSFN